MISMNSIRRWLIVSFILCLLVPVSVQAQNDADTFSCSLAIVYDNYLCDYSLTSDWGFSCVIAGYEKTILFDTGRHGSLLTNHLQHLDIDPEVFDYCFLSHEHTDHIGGISTLIGTVSSLDVACPVSFPTALVESFSASWIELNTISDPEEICPGVWTTGELGTSIREQSLILQTADGLVVITGCAHPGIVAIVKTVISLFPDDPINLIIGGFHLLNESESSVRSIAQDLLGLGVLRVAPTHCSGDLTRAVFADIFGSNYLEAGLGWTIEISL